MGEERDAASAGLSPKQRTKCRQRSYVCNYGTPHTLLYLKFTASKPILKLLENAKLRTRRLGAKGAKAFPTRLSDLEEAENAEELRHVPGNFHALKGERRGQFGWTIDGGKRLIVVSVPDPPPELPDGGTDWAAITAVHLLEIVDYH